MFVLYLYVTMFPFKAKHNQGQVFRIYRMFLTMSLKSEILRETQSFYNLDIKNIGRMANVTLLWTSRVAKLFWDCQLDYSCMNKSPNSTPSFKSSNFLTVWSGGGVRKAEAS